jgi:hypothetical protein
MEEEEKLLLMGRPKVVPFSYYGNDVNNVPAGLLIDDGGVIKQCRWVGNFVNNNSSTLVDRITNTQSINWNNDFDLDIWYKWNNDLLASSGLACFGLATASLRGLWLERDGTFNRYIARLYDSTGAQRATGFLNVPMNAYQKITVKRIGNVLQIFLNGIKASVDGDLTGFTANTTTLTTIGASEFARTMNASLAKVSFSSASVNFCYNMQDGTGTTIRDNCGTANGTLSDGSPNTFWQKDLVPLSVLL